MSGRQIATSVTILNSYLGFQAITLTERLTTGLPNIAAGSKVEIANAMFTFDSNEAINASSWSAISDYTSCYLMLVPSGTAGSQIVTAYFTTDAPVWSDSKQGWYASAASVSRYIGGCFRMDSSTCDYKYVFGNDDEKDSHPRQAKNTRLGTHSLLNNAGIDNIAIGIDALKNNTQGSSNIAIGDNSLICNTTGTENIVIGISSMFFEERGKYNTVVGTACLQSGGTSAFQGVCAFGYNALNSDTASYNCAFGYYALSSNTTGASNCAFGKEALGSNTIGINNCAFGSAALQANTTGENNCAFGDNVLLSNTTGSNNVAIGSSSMSHNTEGSNNIAIGETSLHSNTTGISNVSIGKHSLFLNTAGNSNVAIGLSALVINSVGSFNIAIGETSLCSNTTGGANIAIGGTALYSNAIGNSNIAIGLSALLNSTGSFNIAIGESTLTGLLSGDNNFALGSNAGFTLNYGSNNTCIGCNSDVASATVSNSFTLGNGSVSVLRCAVTTITALSDERDKANIEPFALGLSVMDDIRFYSYQWDKREWYKDGKRDGSHMEKERHIGVMAQEMRKLEDKHHARDLRLVYDVNSDKLEASPGNLLPILVNSIKELKAKNEELERKMKHYESLLTGNKG